MGLYDSWLFPRRISTLGPVPGLDARRPWQKRGLRFMFATD